MPGIYQYDVEIKSNVAKLLSDMKQVQDRLDTVEGKEYKIKLNVDEKKLSSVISNLEKMLDSLGKGTGDFKQFENLSKELSSVVSEVQSLSKAFGKVDDSGTKTLLSSIQNIDKSLSELSQHILNVNKNMGNMGGNTSGAVKQVENIGNAAADAVKQVDKLADAQSKTNVANGLDSSISKYQEIVSLVKEYYELTSKIKQPTLKRQSRSEDYDRIDGYLLKKAPQKVGTTDIKKDINDRYHKMAKGVNEGSEFAIKAMKSAIQRYWSDVTEMPSDEKLLSSRKVIPYGNKGQKEEYIIPKKYQDLEKSVIQETIAMNQNNAAYEEEQKQIKANNAAIEERLNLIRQSIKQNNKNSDYNGEYKMGLSLKASDRNKKDIFGMTSDLSQEEMLKEICNMLGVEIPQNAEKAKQAIKEVSSTPQESNISSGSNPAIEEQNKFQSELQETASDYEKVTEAHKQMIQSAVNSIPQEENTARYVHWGNSEQSTAILSNPNGMNTGDYGLISSFADCIGEAETSMNAIVKDWDYLHAENFDKGSALIMDIPLDQVKEFEHGLKDNIPQEFIKGWVDTENGVITLNNTLQSELKETQDQAEKTAQSVKNAVSQTTKKDAFHSDIDTSSSVKSLENLEEEIKKIFTDANELQNILDSLHNGKYFHLSWTTDGIDETGADERVRQLFELLEEYGYTINNFKSDSDAFDTSGVINAIKEENNVLEQNTQKIKENTQAKEQNANANLNKYDKRLDSYNSKIDKYKTTIDRFNDGGWTSSTYLENVQAVKNAVHEYETLLNELKGKDASLVTSDDISKLDEYEKKIKDTIATVTNMSASEKGYNFVSGQKELDKIHKLLNENSKMSSEAKAKIKAYYAEIESGNPSMSLDKIHGEILKIYNAEVEAGRAGRTLWDTLKNSGFHQLAAQMAGMFGFYDVINLGKEGFNVVRELNTAFTEMRKVSDETVQSLKDYQATTFDTADAVGTTAKQIQNSTADWMRLGESMNQAAESAKDANVLLNVSEFEGIDEATESLVSMSQAYKDLDKMDIIDVLNNIGNNYSISTDGLATALKDSASALVTANNDLNEAVSLTTAGNAITQDPSKVGAGLRTISLRLVGTEEAKQELSDLGEETDGMITTVSKLRDTIMDATKAASSDGKGFDILDSNGNYKSTYEIMQGLADLYDNIVKKDKELGTNNLNLLLETIAGKNRSNIAASILQNGDMLRSVYEDAQNSEGSAEKELNSYLDSIDGKMAQLENRAQEFWFKVIDSETIKNGIDLLSTLLKGATDFVDTVGLLPTILTGIGAALSFKNVGRDKMYSLSF